MNIRTSWIHSLKHSHKWGLCFVVVTLFLLVPTCALATEPAFTAAPGSPLSPSTGERSSLAFSPVGGLLASGSSIFSVAASGALTPLPGAPPDPYAGALAFSPNGKLLAAADHYGPTPAGGNTVSIFSVGSSGALTPVSGSPFTVGAQPTSVSFSPNGGLLAVTAAGKLYMFSVGSSGSLTPAAGSPFGISASQVAFSPASGLLATVEVNTGVTMYSVTPAGALTKVAGSPFKAFGAAASAVAFGPNGSFLAQSNFSGGVTMYSVGSTGVLTAVGSAPFDPTFQANAVAFSPDGSTVAATKNDGPGVVAFSVGSSGALTISAGSPFATPGPPLGVAFSSTGLLSTTDLDNELTVLAPTSASSATNWVGSFGADGYDLAGWSGQSDASDLPNASVSLVQGNRYTWAVNTSDTRALPSPDGSRNASTYYDYNQIQVKLTFHAAYAGNLRLYAVDWDSGTRRESLAVGGHSAIFSNKWGGFSAGQWASFPIDVAAGGTVTIAVTREAGANAVLSGIFLGDEGPPPAIAPSTAPQGSWVGVYGSGGYALAAWNGSSDLVSLPVASLNLAQGSRYQWSGPTAETRALQSPNGLSREAATYYDASQVRLNLLFNSAYTGSLRLYALDWDSHARRELISVGAQTAALSNDFGQGAWLSFPISVAAGETLPIVINRTGGTNAVLSGIFLG